MQRKPPGLIDRAAIAAALSSPIYDYVVMSHVGATPRRSRRVRLSITLGSLFCFTRFASASRLCTVLHIFAHIFPQIVSNLLLQPNLFLFPHHSSRSAKLDATCRFSLPSNPRSLGQWNYPPRTGAIPVAAMNKGG